jgi:hypothetical protein
MSRLVVLQRLKDAHQAKAQLAAQQALAAQAAPSPDPAIVERLFGGGMGDTLAGDMLIVYFS